MKSIVVALLSVLFLSNLLWADITKPAVATGEYASSYTLGSVKLYWNVDQTAATMELAMVAPTSGWVAIAFNPTSVHINMDAIMGYVDANNVAQVGDYWVYDKVAPTLDTAAGGRDNILQKNGQTVGGSTTIKWVRQLNTGDARDKVIASGANVNVYYSYSTSKDTRVKHTSFGKATIRFFTQGVAPSNSSTGGGTGGGGTGGEGGNIGGEGGEGSTENVSTQFELFPYHYVIFPALCVFMIFVTFLAKFVSTSTIVFYFAHLRVLPPITQKYVRMVFGETLDLTLGEAFLVVSHTLCIILYFVIGVINAPQTTFIPKVARGFGVLTEVLCAWVMLPVTRNGIWSIFGVPFDRMLRYHRWIGNWLFWSVLLHGFFMLLYYSNLGNITYLLATEPNEFGFVFCGFAAFIAYFIMYMYSFETVRRKMWEWFHFSHMLAIPAAVFSSMHHWVVAVHFSVGMLLMVIDMLVRAIRIIRPTSIVTMMAMPGNVTRLELKKPSFRYTSGQYVFLWLGRISLLQWHPFSISSGTTESSPDTFTIHVKNMGRVGERSWTSKLNDLARKYEGTDKAKTLSIACEGPYGSMTIDPFQFKISILVGGGIGVTPMMSILNKLHDMCVKEQKTIVEKMYLVWTVPNAECLEWFRCELEAFVQNTKIALQIYITRKAPESEAIPTISGRPDYDSILTQVLKDHPDVSQFGVCACGPAGMMHDVESSAYWKSGCGQRIHVHKEVFEF